VAGACDLLLVVVVAGLVNNIHKVGWYAGGFKPPKKNHVVKMGIFPK